MPRLFARAFLQVALVSANVAFLAAHNTVMAFITGYWISWVWWGNAKSAAHHPSPYARMVYGAGAACGTVVGMRVATWLGVWL